MYEIWKLYVKNYCKTLIIRVTLFSRNHRSSFIHKTLFSPLVISSSIVLTLQIIGEGFIFSMLSRIYAKIKSSQIKSVLQYSSYPVRTKVLKKFSCDLAFDLLTSKCIGIFLPPSWIMYEIWKLKDEDLSPAHMTSLDQSNFFICHINLKRYNNTCLNL